MINNQIVVNGEKMNEARIRYARHRITAMWHYEQKFARDHPGVTFDDKSYPLREKLAELDALTDEDERADALNELEDLIKASYDKE